MTLYTNNTKKSRTYKTDLSTARYHGRIGLAGHDVFGIDFNKLPSEVAQLVLDSMKQQTGAFDLTPDTLALYVELDPCSCEDLLLVDWIPNMAFINQNVIETLFEEAETRKEYTLFLRRTETVDLLNLIPA